MMRAQDRTEQVLKDIHVLFAKAEPYGSSEVSVVVNKEEVMALLKKLNGCLNDLLDEYQMTEEGRDRARREEEKVREEKVLEAKKKAEDVYAASLMYTDNALKEISRIMDSAAQEMDMSLRNMKEELTRRQDTVKSNQLELRSQLGNLIDSEKYMKLIEEENNGRLLEDGDEEALDRPAFADIKPEIKINTEYFRANGIPLEDEEQKKEGKNADEEEGISSDDLDAEYFGWQEEQEKGADQDNEKKSDKKSFFSFWQ